MPANKNLDAHIWRGDTFGLPLKFMTEGADQSLEGLTLVFTLKMDPMADDADADILKSVTFANPDATVAEGDYTIHLSASETETLRPGTYVYKVQLVEPAAPEDIVTTYLYGKAAVKDS